MDTVEFDRVDVVPFRLLIVSQQHSIAPLRRHPCSPEVDQPNAESLADEFRPDDHGTFGHALQMDPDRVYG